MIRLKNLFPIDLTERSWMEFPAESYSKPASGVIYRAANPVVCGMPLGGIDTGCIDLETNGTFGYCSIFNSHVPRRGPLNLPFLGISLPFYHDPHKDSRKTWLLTTQPTKGIDRSWLTYANVDNEGLHIAKDIHYWGHYPIVDMEYEIDAPISVGLRAWTPFVPGDVAISNTPGAVFEVRIRNTDSKTLKGTVAFSFPGPSPEESCGVSSYIHHHVAGEFSGVHVSNNGVPGSTHDYALGVIGKEETIRCGGDIGTDGGAWTRTGHALPHEVNQSGASVSVDFELQKGEERIIRFVLAWYSPQWRGQGTPMAGGNLYSHMYASRYKTALEVAGFIVREHKSLLRRVIAWQEVIYADKSLPVWLKDSLINNLYLITECGLWAQAKPPIGEWCRPEDGLFGMNDDPRSCPQMACPPCAFYGNVPFIYLFPELELSLLRGYKAYQYPDGATVWNFGGIPRPIIEMATPYEGTRPTYQDSLNGCCYTVLVDRYWQRSRDKNMLKEFYPSVKKSIIFTMNLCKEKGLSGVVSIPEKGNVWFECVDLFGIVPHLGGVHLACLEIAERMANELGDKEFALQCREWFSQGSKVMEEETWTGDYYLLYKDPSTGIQSDLVMAYQLDGDWIAKFHGLKSVFYPERIKTTLQTIKRISVTERGGVVFRPGPQDGGKTTLVPEQGQELKEGEFKTGYWGPNGVHPPASMMLGMIYMYYGEKEFGLELVRRVMHTMICEKGWTWSQPCVFNATTTERIAGFDYYQNLMLWALPAAIEGQDLVGPYHPGGLVARILKAGQVNV